VEALQRDQRSLAAGDVAALVRSREAKRSLLTQLAHDRDLARHEPSRAPAGRVEPSSGRAACDLPEASARLRAVSASLRELLAAGPGLLELGVPGIRRILHALAQRCVDTAR